MDYKKTASEIVELIGGKENIASLTHCITRVRFKLKDDAKADADKVKAVDGVINVLRQCGQFQVVIGNEVSNLFKEFQKMGNFGDNAAAAPQKPEGNPT